MHPILAERSRLAAYLAAWALLGLLLAALLVLAAPFGWAEADTSLQDALSSARSL